MSYDFWKMGNQLRAKRTPAAPASDPTEAEIRQMTVLVIDNGLFLELARTLGKSVKKCYYHVPWQCASPKMNPAYIGYGFDEIEVVLDPWIKGIGESDLVVFFDIYYPGLQAEMERQGKLVFGCREGERMEVDRAWMKKTMEAKGLPVQSWRAVTGLPKAREYLQTHQNVFLKVSRWRGNFETIHADNYRRVEPRMDRVEVNLGPLKHLIPLTIENRLEDCVEYGIDTYLADGQHANKVLGGAEIKGEGVYLGEFKNYTAFPKEMTNFLDAMAPNLKTWKYRGFLSFDMRIDKHRKGIMIDACTRAPSPPGDVYGEFYENFAQIVLGTAKGRVVEARPAGKYAALAVIESPSLSEDAQEIEFPKENAQWIKLRSACKINGRYYVIPQQDRAMRVGCVLGIGDSQKEAIRMATEMGKSIEGEDLDVKILGFERVDEVLEKTKKFKIPMFE